ncbi:MAG: TRAP transporter large permease subunit [Alphaproteobacteria bacterium]|nr:MAG: TRAP transporter large permease subunit [Alphaproteobacteria bacterium]
MSQAVIGEIIALIMFVATIFVVFIGYPVSFSLAGLALIFAWIGHWFGVFDYALLTGLASRYFGTMINEVLVAVPLFVFMGVVLERSKIAETLLTTMGQMFGGMRGGLGISVVIVGALLAASTGIVGATVVTMGLLSLPAMMRAGYDPKLAAGVICASGTLGQIIPPSTVLIFIGDLLQGANARAQAEIGNLTPDPISVGELFVGALIPGVSLAVLYALWVLYRAYTDPHAAPPLVMTAHEKAGLGRRIVVALVPPLLLILAVLGSILAGIATPTESASFGAVGALLLTQIKNIAEHFAGTTDEDELEQIMFKFWLVFLAVLIALGFIFGLAGLLIAMTGGFILGTLVTRSLAGKRPLDDADFVDGVRDLARRLGVQPRVPRPRRRKGGGRHPGSHARRPIRRGDAGNAHHVRARVLPRHVRDHLHHGANHGSRADQDGCRPAVAWRVDGHEPANLVPDPAVRLRLVLLARRVGKTDLDHADLSRRAAVRVPAGVRDWSDVGRTGTGNLAAGRSVRRRPRQRPVRAQEPGGEHAHRPRDGRGTGRYVRTKQQLIS